MHGARRANRKRQSITTRHLRAVIERKQTSRTVAVAYPLALRRRPLTVKLPQRRNDDRQGTGAQRRPASPTRGPTIHSRVCPPALSSISVIWSGTQPRTHCLALAMAFLAGDVLGDCAVQVFGCRGRVRHGCGATRSVRRTPLDRSFVGRTTPVLGASVRTAASPDAGL